MIKLKLPVELKSVDLKNIDWKDTRTQTLVLMILISSILFILYLYFVFFPQVIRVATLIGKTVSIQMELKSARLKIAKIGELRKDLAEYNEKVELHEKKLPAEQEIPSLLETLSSMARGANIKILGIMPVPSYFKDMRAKGSRIYQEIPILITAKSGYHELGAFLSALENADRFIKVVDIDIKANKTSPRMHDVELMVCTYILLPEK